MEDGGVDISPIADCTKTQVWELGKYLGILKKLLTQTHRWIMERWKIFMMLIN